ncbi:hypothetical protein D9757_003556 [Collybiopsis confluens]|uniref:Polynucleotide 5'-hydroxyl-kinase GRC3 n=1 Tax=Collybiopsis confluens TaxID=2823264 RepID=A0A8H5HUL8_9AGAR|nr:hypothetical protein D9757_003556 [Collybiopsis confluens]
MSEENSPKVWILEPENEYRFELDPSSSLAITLVRGRAEIFGAELVERRPYLFGSECKAALRAHFPIYVIGQPSTEYVSDDTPMAAYGNLHMAFEQMRVRALAKIHGSPVPKGPSEIAAEPPRVLVLGPENSGKTSICKILVNYAVRAGQGWSPLLANVDPRWLGSTWSFVCCSHSWPDNNIFCCNPLGFAATSAPTTLASNAILPISYWYGHADTKRNSVLMDRLIRNLGFNVQERIDHDPEGQTAGIILDTPSSFASGPAGGNDHRQKLIRACIDAFRINVILVVGHEKLKVEMERAFGTLLTVVKIPKSGGVVELDHSYRERRHKYQLHAYMYGDVIHPPPGIRTGTQGGETLTDLVLAPSSTVINFSDLTIYRIGAETMAPSDALPIGAARVVSEMQPVPVDPSRSGSGLLNSVLAVLAPFNPDENERYDEELLDLTVVGFIVVTSLDIPHKKMTILSPTQGSLIGKTALAIEIPSSLEKKRRGLMALSIAGPSSAGIRDGYFPCDARGTSQGVDLVGSFRDSVSAALADMDISDLELLYPDEEPASAPERVQTAQGWTGQEEASPFASDLDDFQLVYPDALPSPGASSQGPQAAYVHAEVPVPLDDPSLLQHPQSTIKASPKYRAAIMIPTITSVDSTQTRSSSSTPHHSPGSFAAYQAFRRQRSFPPPVSPVPLRICSNEGCTSIVGTDSCRRRCMGCVVRGWKEHDPRLQSSTPPAFVSPAPPASTLAPSVPAPPAFVHPTPALPLVYRTSSIIKKRDKQNKKRVSWFDGYQKDGGMSKKDVVKNGMEVFEHDVSPTAEKGNKYKDVDTEMQSATGQGQGSPSLESAEAGPSSGKLFTRCAIKGCGERLPPGCTRKRCASCLKSRKKYQRKRLGCNAEIGQNDSETLGPDDSKESILANLVSASTFSTSRLGNYTLQDPAGLVTSGSRICAVSGCQHIVPNAVEYRDDICFLCHVQRENQDIKYQAERPGPGLAPVEKEDPSLESNCKFPVRIQLPHNLLRSLIGRCSHIDCGMKLELQKIKSLRARAKGPLNPNTSLLDYDDSICEQCTWRRASDEARKGRILDVHLRVRILLQQADDPDGSMDSSEPIEVRKASSKLPVKFRGSTPTIKIPPRPVPPPKPLGPTPYPEYQSLNRLITDLQDLYVNYLQAQALYYLALYQTKPSDSKRSGSTRTPPFMSKFTFDGEFSAVALDFDIPGRKDEVNEYVTMVIREIERVAMVKARPGSRVFAVACGGIVTRLSCRGTPSLAFPRHGGKEGGEKEAPRLLKREVTGELEVVVLPVDSHRCFCGQRTVVRLRLVG